MSHVRRCFLIAIAFFKLHAHAQSFNEVATESGKIRGTQYNENLYIYRGIPYAQSPTGDLRWNPPIPPKPWKDIRDASKFGAECMQPIPNPRPNGIQFAEDCLFINVYRPLSTNGEPLPVLIWIGGNSQGFGLTSSVPAENLAKQGVVVVTFNYRMGRFGFFAHPAIAREERTLRGNYGYMDQIAAFEWVQRNISEFDGNRHNVTIGGASFGGGSVLAMMTSPLAQGLFHRAILQSPLLPTARAPALPLRDITVAEKQAANFVRGLGIEGSIQEVLTSLRKISPANLNNGTEEPMIDGIIIPQTIESLIMAEEFSKIPVLMGTTDADWNEPALKSKAIMFAQFGKLAPKARTIYDSLGERSLSELTQTLISDRNMHEPVRFFAERLTKANQPVYLYRFAYVNSAKRESTSGASHGSEIPYVFDSVSSTFGKSATDEDVEMGRIVSDYWISFIKRGRPFSKGQPPWNHYSADARELIVFSNKKISFEEDPLTDRLNLWQEVWEPATTK